MTHCKPILEPHGLSLPHMSKGGYSVSIHVNGVHGEFSTDIRKLRVKISSLFISSLGDRKGVKGKFPILCMSPFDHKPLIAAYRRHAGQGTTMHTLLLGRSCQSISRSYWKAKLHQSCTGSRALFSPLFSLISLQSSVLMPQFLRGKTLLLSLLQRGLILLEGGWYK